MKILVLNTHGLGGEMRKASALVFSDTVEKAVGYMTGANPVVLQRELLGDVSGVWAIRTADSKVAVIAVEMSGNSVYPDNQEAAEALIQSYWNSKRPSDARPDSCSAS